MDLTAAEAVKKYFNMVYKLAFARTGNVCDAEDVTQEVFLRYIQKHSEFESEEHIKAWLIRVTASRAVDLFRRAERRRTQTLDENAVFTDDKDLSLYYAVRELPEKYRTVIHLHYYEEMSVHCISEYLGVKENTVKSRLKRGRELLRSALKEDCGIV